MTVVFVFPGQNSRYPSMIDRLVAADPAVERTLRRASDVLGRDLREHYRAEHPAIFARNRDVQVGVFLANFLFADILSRRGVRSDCSLGLSLGEYNHLVDIGALTLEQALPLVEARGIAYERSPSGAMAAAFPLAEGEARDILARLGCGDSLAIGMSNAPAQQVFSGGREAVDRACDAAHDEYFAQSVVIEDRLPMHGPLFRGVAREYAHALRGVAWACPRKPYVSNVAGGFIDGPAAGDFVRLLGEHLCRTVRWRQSIDAVLAWYPDAVFIEVGPKAVLSNLLRRRWVDRPVLEADAVGDLRVRLDEIVGLCAPCNLLN